MSYYVKCLILNRKIYILAYVLTKVTDLNYFSSQKDEIFFL